jgi:hypothetical protein
MKYFAACAGAQRGRFGLPKVYAITSEVEAVAKLDDG